jgi:ATP-dependent helicase Lhr and Lhr-like helicase
MITELFHPAVAGWFTSRFGEPTPAQASAWPEIAAKRHTLIAAPTGSGKTLAAFLAAIDGLVRQGVEGRLTESTQIVYVSPLKALSNDIERNLRQPLLGIKEMLLDQYLIDLEIRAAVRTGDTPASERASMLKHPPHILVTTPESLYLLVTSEKGRMMLGGVHTLIVDEIHAVYDDKRGSHLSLTIERLQSLVEKPLTRIGISATQRPIENVARFLVGSAHIRPDGSPDCTIVDTGHNRPLDLAIEIPNSPLSAVMANEVWDEVYQKLEELVCAHTTTLIFVNTRRLAERLSSALSERLGEGNVTAHHGSMAKEHRHAAEQNLKDGKLRAIVATASLELGIDIGSVELVCQIGASKSISTFLQRVGRSGHFVGGLPKGRLFPLTRDELIECGALLYAIRRKELDKLILPEKPIDILAQQIVAEVACREWEEADLYKMVTAAWPYRDLTREEFSGTLSMISEGYTNRRGRKNSLLHHDVMNGKLRSRKGARLAALTNGGAIPDLFDYDVILEPQGMKIGSLNEDYSIDSSPGDIFQLGNNSWRILKVETGIVRVEDAQGLPPSIPFWEGEAPGRTDEFSDALSRFRDEVAEKIEYGLIKPPSPMENGEISEPFRDVMLWGKEAIDWLRDEVGIAEAVGEQIAHYLATAKLALGSMPTRQRLVMERFFDEAGDMHVVLHVPFGSRMNRAWGLALRKRFCRNFNFELQAAATENAIILSLGSTHSFPLEEVFHYLKPETAKEILIQAIFDAPVFGTRWRWNASRALAILRNRAGKRVPPHLQRMNSEDLVALVFPDQLACLENIQGDREIPDHPLVKQTIHDCLTEAMDIEGLERILTELAEDKLELISKDLREPSPLAMEIINARPYAFLDDAGLEERRTRAVRNRRWLDPAEAAELANLSPEAIAGVKAEAWPQAENADELHDALMVATFFTSQEIERGDGMLNWNAWLEELQQTKRACCIETKNGATLHIATERLPMFRSAFEITSVSPEVTLPAQLRGQEWTPENALKEIVRGRLECLGPVNAAELAASMKLELSPVDMALLMLEGEGFVFRGKFNPGTENLEWCERRLLARIHRYTLDTLRKEIQPVSAQDFMRFLFMWHRMIPGDQPDGPLALQAILEKLEGFEAPAASWESDLLPTRMEDYDPGWLDVLCMSGKVAWGRFRLSATVSPKRAGAIRTSPITLVNRVNLQLWKRANATTPTEPTPMSGAAESALQWLQNKGASFFEDISRGTRMLNSQMEEALAELVSLGLVTSDSFTGLRALLTPSSLRPSADGKGRRKQAIFGMAQAGRWSLLQSAPDSETENAWNETEEIARVLLRRYGVLFRRITEHENNLPPWRELLRVLRRMELRGEVRGGRFVEGMYGEQYALPEAVTQLRNIRRAAKTGVLIPISAADPLNLAGVVTPGEKVSSLPTNRILYQDGIPVAVMQGKEFRCLIKVSAAVQWEMQKATVRRKVTPQLRAYLGKD